MKNLESKQYRILNHPSPLERQLSDESLQEIDLYLQILLIELTFYFLNTVHCPYIANPFSVSPPLLTVETAEQENMIGIQSDETAKAKHMECSPTNFRLNMTSMYPTLAQNDFLLLLFFP